MRKVAYYWINSYKLSFLSASNLALSKLTESTIKQIGKIQTLELYSEFVKIYWEQNKLLQEKIYTTLVDFGYLSSMDEFYRINRVTDSIDEP